MRPPLVAITTSLVPEAGRYRRPEVALYAIYVSILERLDIAAVLLTPAHSLRSCERLLEHCRGLILSGGEDIDPARFGEEPIPELGMVNPARDAMEFAALELALDRDMPVLGICRGCQVLNVFLGGTLYQDVDAQRSGDLRHRQAEAWEMRSHHVHIDPDSRLAAIVDGTEIQINSFHHQAIRDPAPMLNVVARAEDGLIEAVELPEARWVLGVQWHPERHEATAPDTDPDRRLFLAFREAVAAYAREARE